jgi:hypothetical protein
VLCAVLALAGCAAGGQPSRGDLVVGAVEDDAKWGDAAGEMALARRAGFRAIVLSSLWRPPLRSPTDLEQVALRRAVEAAAGAAIRPIVAVYQFSGTTPLSAEARSQFADYTAAIVRSLPQLREVIVGNEPNLNLFWMPQFAADGSDAAASAYALLLAETYDAVKAVRDVDVIGGALAPRGKDDPGALRQTQSPTAFIRNLGAAYRRSGRTRPLMDAISIHPYPENPRISPDFRHPRTTSIGIGDYDKLVALLREAFGTVPPIIYGEYGVETAASGPPYSGQETTNLQLDEPAQGRVYAEAIRLAACQPLVRMLLFFHVSDEPRLEGLQTGVYRADGTPKQGLATVTGAAVKAEAGQLECRS